MRGVLSAETKSLHPEQATVSLAKGSASKDAPCARAPGTR